MFTSYFGNLPPATPPPPPPAPPYSCLLSYPNFGSSFLTSSLVSTQFPLLYLCPTVGPRLLRLLINPPFRTTRPPLTHSFLFFLILFPLPFPLLHLRLLLLALLFLLLLLSSRALFPL